MVYNKGLRYWLRGLYDLFVKLKILKGYNFDTVQKFSSDGYYHKHYTPKKLINELKLIGFKNLEYELSHVENISLTFVKRRTNLDNFLKKNFGDFLIVYGKK
jgi:hypothetical protein